MKWLLLVSALLGTDVDPMLFATEAECMAAAAAVAEANPGWEWLDRPGAASELRQLVARNIIECVGAEDEAADAVLIPVPK